MGAVRRTEKSSGLYYLYIGVLVIKHWDKDAPTCVAFLGVWILFGEIWPFLFVLYLKKDTEPHVRMILQVLLYLVNCAILYALKLGLWSDVMC